MGTGPCMQAGNPHRPKKTSGHTMKGRKNGAWKLTAGFSQVRTGLAEGKSHPTHSMSCPDRLCRARSLSGPVRNRRAHPNSRSQRERMSLQLFETCWTSSDGRQLPTFVLFFCLFGRDNRPKSKHAAMSVLIKSRRNRPVLLLIRRHLNDLDYIQVYAYCFELSSSWIQDVV